MMTRVSQAVPARMRLFPTTAYAAMESMDVVIPNPEGTHDPGGLYVPHVNPINLRYSNMSCNTVVAINTDIAHIPTWGQGWDI